MTRLYLFPILAFLSITNLFSSDFKAPPLTEYRINLVERSKLGTIEDRVKAIVECGVSRPAVCYYALVNLLGDESAIIREQAALSLGMMRYPEAIKFIEIALNKEQVESVQAAMLRSLHLFKNPGTLAISEKFLDHNSERIRFVAARVFVSYPKEASYEILNKRLSVETSDLVKVILIHALLKIKKTNDNIITLVKYFNDTNRSIRLYAGRAAADLKIMDTLSSLKKSVLLESDPEVREEFYRAYDETYHQ